MNMFSDTSACSFVGLFLKNGFNSKSNSGYYEQDLPETFLVTHLKVHA